MKRVAKPSKWYSYDVKCFDTDLSVFSCFVGSDKKLSVADTSIELRNVDFYKFNKHEQPYYIWDVPFLPFHKGYLGYFNFMPKHHSETDLLISYGFKSRNYAIFIEVEKATSLIRSYTIEDIQNGYIHKYSFKYYYFKSGKVCHNIDFDSTRNLYLPVMIENENIKNSIAMKLMKRNNSSNIIDTTMAIRLLQPYLLPGKEALLIDFWHISCVPCRKALPLLDSLSMAAGNEKRIAVLLINVNDSEQDVAYFKKKYNFSFTNLCDTGHIIEKYFKPPSYPTTILLDGSFREKTRISGANRYEILSIFQNSTTE